MKVQYIYIYIKKKRVDLNASHSKQNTQGKEKIHLKPPAAQIATRHNSDSSSVPSLNDLLPFILSWLYLHIKCWGAHDMQVVHMLLPWESYVNYQSQILSAFFYLDSLLCRELGTRLVPTLSLVTTVIFEKNIVPFLFIHSSILFIVVCIVCYKGYNLLMGYCIP